MDGEYVRVVAVAVVAVVVVADLPLLQYIR